LSIKCHIGILVPFKFLIDPCCNFRWVDLHTYAEPSTSTYSITWKYEEAVGSNLKRASPIEWPTS
jgi:hypothetical protein